MHIEHCVFPDDLYYDVEGDTWIRPVSPTTQILIGVTTILSALAGKFTTVKLKKETGTVRRGDSIGTVESGKYFGAIRSPIVGRVVELNSRVELDPCLLNDSPYSDGWVARVECEEDGKLPYGLQSAQDAAEELRTRIGELRVRCFKKVPDDELYAVGSECLATLVNLGELMKARPTGNVVHIVSDDPTASAELGRWAELTKNQILESRDEGNLHHFLVEKSAQR